MVLPIVLFTITIASYLNLSIVLIDKYVWLCYSVDKR